MKKNILLLILSLSLFAQANSTIDSFSKSKKLLKEVYKDHQVE